MPLAIIGAMTQGQIGYMIESSLDTALMEIGIETEQSFCTLITYVVVDAQDPGFLNPSKPIGPFFTEEPAATLPYHLVETDKGYRRVVASPQPVAIVEHREIKRLIDMDFIVICAGGGGIPVVRKGRRFSGVEAVIDKDLASAVLAREIGADLFIIATDTEGAAIHWGKPGQAFLRKVPVAEMEAYIREKHFPSGSMGPKIEAILEFFQTTRKRGIICHLKDIQKAIAETRKSSALLRLRNQRLNLLTHKVAFTLALPYLASDEKNLLDIEGIQRNCLELSEMVNQFRRNAAYYRKCL